MLERLKEKREEILDEITVLESDLGKAKVKLEIIEELIADEIEDEEETTEESTEAVFV